MFWIDCEFRRLHGQEGGSMVRCREDKRWTGRQVLTRPNFFMMRSMGDGILHNSLTFVLHKSLTFVSGAATTICSSRGF